MFDSTREPEIVPITKYRIELVNHGVGWEFYGLRMTELRHIVWFLGQRFQQLKQSYLARQEQDPDFDPLGPNMEIKLMDLITLTIGYFNIAIDADTPLPQPPMGGQFALQVGAGVYLIIETFAGGEIPTCGFGDVSYN